MTQKKNKGAAKKAINTYIEHAKQHPAHARRSITLARKVSLHYKVPFTKEQKNVICKKCGTISTPGKDARIRIHRGKVIRTCLTCKNIIRIPLGQTTKKASPADSGQEPPQESS